MQVSKTTVNDWFDLYKSKLVIYTTNKNRCNYNYDAISHCYSHRPWSTQENKNNKLKYINVIPYTWFCTIKCKW